MRDPRSADLPSTLQWHKSSYSNQDGGNCLEVATGHPTLVPVRDSKSPGTGTLIFPEAAWRRFIEGFQRSHA